jgi:hypothetical protein
MAGPPWADADVLNSAAIMKVSVSSKRTGLLAITWLLKIVQG